MALMSLLLLLTLLPLTASTSEFPFLTAHQFLSLLSFPPGLIPDSVTSYSAIQVDDGINFAIYLKKPCYVKMPWLAHEFGQEITGKFTQGNIITDVKGLKVQWMPLGPWFDVMKITASGGNLMFSVFRHKFETSTTSYKDVPTCKDEALAVCDD